MFSIMVEEDKITVFKGNINKPQNTKQVAKEIVDLAIALDIKNIYIERREHEISGGHTSKGSYEI